MQRSWAAMLPWGAVAVFVLAALVAMPHFHDEADPRGDSCVRCAVHGEAPGRSDVHEAPAAHTSDAAPAPAPTRAGGAEGAGLGPRAPPA